ncbi:LlaJI family restriction endonuclease [Fibrella arboris]|uniref:LlaJI family restriction endonuclease n=1 Tax=Fibrella arboris TaxID=3242486 RepID=UPI00352126FF
MTILFEEYPYETTYLATLLPERYYWPISPTHSKIPFVGYCHAQQQAVVILPKVFLHQGHFLGDYSPDDLRQLPERPDLRQKLKTEQRLDFLFTMSTWLYLAIRQFQRLHPDNDITEATGLPTIVGTTDQQAATELDWVLSLLRFFRDNQSLLTFLKKRSMSQRGKTDWNRTVSRQLPIIDANGRPVYIRTDTKQQAVNIDEELIVLFLVVLEELQKRYYLRINLPDVYRLPTGPERRTLLNNGLRRLRQIRYKYFSDRLLQLWNLLWGYFSYQEHVASGRQQPEVTLARDFNRVFEDMIDGLLSERSALDRFKVQKDGKELDHIYDYQDLLATDHIYYIGDSKYYKDTTKLGRESIHKQYTYAKNVIQYNIDLLNRDQLAHPLRYRDDLTEGYNPTPNFFISAVVDDQLTWTQAGLTFNGSIEPPNQHFSDRLFDRDTLLLQTYNINFLYVLSTYVSDNRTEKQQFQERTRQLFRTKLTSYLQEHYKFYKVKPQTGTLEDFVTQHFKTLLGKMYRPSDFTDALLIALPNSFSDAWFDQFDTIDVKRWNLSSVII